MYRMHRKSRDVLCRTRVLPRVGSVAQQNDVLNIVRNRPAAVWFLAAGTTIPASQEVEMRAVRDSGVIVFTAARRCISSPTTTTTTGTSRAGKAAKTKFRRAGIKCEPKLAS